MLAPSAFAASVKLVLTFLWESRGLEGNAPVVPLLAAVSSPSNSTFGSAETPASTQHFCSVSDLFFWCLYINTVHFWARRKRSCIQNSGRVTCIGWGLLILDAETGSYLAYEDGGMPSHD